MKQKLLKLMCLLCVSMMGMSAWGDEASFAPSNFSGQGTSGTGSAISATVGEITFACDKGYGTTQVRCYSGGKITISSSKTITAISFTFSGSYTGGMETSYTGLSTNSWEKNLSSQARITAVTVTYTSKVATTTTISDAGITNTDVYVGTAAGSLSASVTETESGDAVDGATVTWSGDNDEVATINATTGVVTLVAAGTVTFTATYAENVTYATSSDTYKMKVVENIPDPYMWVETSLSALTASDIFVIVGDNGDSYAMTNDNEATSAPEAVSVTISNNKISSTVAANMKWNISGNATDGYTFYPNGDDENWLYCTNTNNGVRVGTNANKTFKVVDEYLQHTGTSRYVGIYNSQDWRCYTGTNGNIEGQTFKFYKAVDATYTRSVTEGNWGTICLPYDATVTGATLYTISHKELDGSSNPTALILSEETGIAGGFPYIFKATGSELVATYTSSSYEDATDIYGLHGTYDAIAKGDFTSSLVPNDDLYLMTATTVQAANYATASVGANRAYILMEEVPTTGSPVKGVRLGFDGTEEATGITELTESTEKTEGTEAIYNLNGQRLNSLQKGINIVGGKKVLVK